MNEYSKNQLVKTWLLRTCYAKICQLSPLSDKNLFCLKFETGSYFLKSLNKVCELG